MNRSVAFSIFLLIGSSLYVQTAKPFFCELVAALVIYRLFVDDARVAYLCHCQKEVDQLKTWMHEHEKHLSLMNKRIEFLIKQLQHHHPELQLTHNF